MKLRSSALLSALALLCSPLAAQRPTAAAPADLAAKQAAWERHQELDGASLFPGLAWRSIGPVVQGGRVVDIETVPGEPYTFYVAYASGGLWKTTNNGVTFEPVFDDQPVVILGDVAVDPSRPETVWVGTGENNSSRSSYGGLGIFRSDDAGATWRWTGLGETDRIGRILVDPRDSDRVFVAALGRLYTPGGQRGVYRTADGGETWEQVLAGDEVTGFVDLVMHPTNPDVLYAAAWERSRRPWNFTEGGDGSGIWKTTDGGVTWSRLEGGFPRGEHVGRIGLAVAASQPDTVYASLDDQTPLPEQEWDLGDGAVTPKRLRTMTEQELLRQDPEAIEDFIRGNDLDTELTAEKLIEMVEKGEVTIQDLLDEISDANANLFDADIEGLQVWRSDDAGATWRLTHGEPIREMVYTYGYYFGEIRVSPKDPERIYLLGVPIITSGDGGKSFESIQDPDVHVDYHAMWIDPNFPDRFFVGNDGGIDVSYDGGRSWLNLDAQPVGQFYAITVDMAKPYNVYGGLQDNGSYKGGSRTDWRLGQRWTRIGGGDGMYVQVDPRDNQTVYTGFQFGFYGRSGPDGRQQVRPRDKLKEPALRYNWQTPIQLSSHNPDIVYFGANRLYRSMDRGESWEPISDDLTRSEMRGDVPFATLTTIDESQRRFGLIWAGTDDGHVWVTDDGGVEWREVSAGLPVDRWVSRVEASHHDEKTAYVSLNGYRDDDITAYLYRTTDLGESWSSLAAGLPAEPINVVREDPVNADVLYVGTDRGVYVSLDRGASWQGLPGGLPNVPVHDLVVHPRDRELVAGTHGRSVWVIDALPIQELDKELRAQSAHLFPVESVEYERHWQGRRHPWFYNPDYDAEIDVPFWTSEAGTVALEVRDAEGRPLRRLEMEAPRGVSTFTWDLLLDEKLALAAEGAARVEAEKKASKEGGKKAKKGEEKEKAAADKGVVAKTPWAEAVRLGWPLYVTPGSYELVLVAPGGEAKTELEVEKPERRDPRAKPEMKIRGEKDD
ncbi:MAG: glycosyl hydrolase [Thermoanaerobaculia bacterium]|nr:glycosyl hydrolase [Thermoanaerobaculia bacterium]